MSVPITCETCGAVVEVETRKLNEPSRLSTWRGAVVEVPVLPNGWRDDGHDPDIAGYYCSPGCWELR